MTRMAGLAAGSLLAVQSRLVVNSVYFLCAHGPNLMLDGRHRALYPTSRRIQLTVRPNVSWSAPIRFESGQRNSLLLHKAIAPIIACLSEPLESR